MENLTKEEQEELNHSLRNMANYGCLEEVKDLIEKGADVDAKNEDGWTALMEAVAGGHLEVVKYLVEVGADVEVRDEDGRTALDLAEHEGYLDIVEYLEGLESIVVNLPKKLTSKDNGQPVHLRIWWEGEDVWMGYQGFDGFEDELTLKKEKDETFVELAKRLKNVLREKYNNKSK